MAIQGVSIALSTEDVARSVKFYVEQLGFTCALQLEGFARVSAGRCRHYAGSANAHVSWQGPRFTGSIYLDVDNVDELWERLKTRVRNRVSNRDHGVRPARVRACWTTTAISCPSPSMLRRN